MKQTDVDTFGKLLSHAADAQGTVNEDATNYALATWLIQHRADLLALARVGLAQQQLEAELDSIADHTLPQQRESHADCKHFSPPEWTGHWREWHRGHGCKLDPDVQAVALPAPPAPPEAEQ